MLTPDLKVRLLTPLATTDLRVDFETHFEPRLELLMSAKF